MLACRHLALPLTLVASLGASQTYAASGSIGANFSDGLTFEWPWPGSAIAFQVLPVSPTYVYVQQPLKMAAAGLPGGVAPVGSISLVPEPHRWATLLTGFGLVILALRRRINR